MFEWSLWRPRSGSDLVCSMVSVRQIYSIMFYVSDGSISFRLLFVVSISTAGIVIPSSKFCCRDKTVRIWAQRTFPSSTSSTADSATVPKTDASALKSTWRCVDVLSDSHTRWQHGFSGSFDLFTRTSSNWPLNPHRTVRSVCWSPCGKFVASSRWQKLTCSFFLCACYTHTSMRQLWCYHSHMASVWDRFGLCSCMNVERHFTCSNIHLQQDLKVFPCLKAMKTRSTKPTLWWCIFERRTKREGRRRFD